MAINRNQAQPNWGLKTALCTLMLLLLPIKNSLANSIESTLEIEPPDNWYQVEVILFTQNGNIGGEAPPQDYQLSFPENWLQLIDPNMPLQQDGFPLAQGSLLYQPPAEESLRMIPMAVVADPLIATEDLFNADSPIAAESTDMALAIEPEQLYEPQYESPFSLLDKELRDLNESAAALDRRQYNVVFHEAWRFAADAEAADPWVVIGAGQRLEDRFQLEGSLRFYKSRFLHFESDLWLLQFANSDREEPARLIELPDFPALAEPDEDPLLRNEFTLGKDQQSVSTDSLGALEINSLGALEINSPEPYEIDSPEPYKIDSPEPYKIESSEPFELNSLEPPQINSLEPLEVDSPEPLALDSSESPELDNLEAAAPDNSQSQKYPVDNVWVLNKSKRIEEQTIYYIDHPEMGIMLTIKPFIPELLNPPERALDPQAEELAEDIIAQPLAQ